MAGVTLLDAARRLRDATSAADVDVVAEEARADGGGGEELDAIVSLAHEAASVRERLGSSNRSREVLLASVAHDLRNPLNTFAMSAGLLRDDLERGDIEAARALSLVTRMDRAMAKMQSLIEDLLEASRIDARKIDYAVRSEKAAPIVHDAAKAASAAAADRAPAVKVDEVDESATAMCDRARTVQILVKMVAYATKSTGEGGSIRLSVTTDGATTTFTARAFGPAGQPVAPPEEGRGGLALLMARGLAEGQRGTFQIEAGDALVTTLRLPAT